jgi:hypothetical protein
MVDAPAVVGRGLEHWFAGCSTMDFLTAQDASNYILARLGLAVSGH